MCFIKWCRALSLSSLLSASYVSCVVVVPRYSLAKSKADLVHIYRKHVTSATLGATLWMYRIDCLFSKLKQTKWQSSEWVAFEVSRIWMYWMLISVGSDWWFKCVPWIIDIQLWVRFSVSPTYIYAKQTIRRCIRCKGKIISADISKFLRSKAEAVLKWLNHRY